MRRFEPVMRVELEQTATGMSAQIIDELSKIEAKARKIREEGRDPRVHLAPEVSVLAGRVNLGYKAEREAIAEQFKQDQEQWETKRDRKPEAELARIERAKLKIDSLDDTEVENLGFQFASGVADISLEEAQRLAARSKKDGKEVVNQAIKDNLLDRPWIRESDDNLKLYARDKAITGVPKENVLVDGMAIHLEHLVDFDNELNQLA